jgi:hypothetical protein
VAAGIAGASLDVRSSGLVFVSGGFGILCLLLLGAALVLGRPGWIGGALGLLAALYLGHTVVAEAPNPSQLGLVAVGLLLVGELGQWSIDGRLGGRYEAGIHISRATAIAVLGLLGLGTVALSQVAAGLPVSGGVGAVALAMGATVALLGLISFVALRRVGSESPPVEAPAPTFRPDAS